MKKTFFKELVDRNVFNELKAYLFGGATIIPLVWLVVDMMISSYSALLSTQICIIVFFAFFPSIFMYAYCHGGDISRNKMSVMEKRFIPINFLFVCLFIGVFYSSNISATQKKSIEIENEFGELSTIEIVKEKYIKNVLIFPFDNNNKDTLKNWLQKGILEGCYVDMLQDQYVNMISAENSIMDLELQSKDLIPLSKKMKIAKEKSLPYFISGNYLTNQELFVVSFEIYDSKNGLVIFRKRIEDKNLFTLIDKITLEIRLGIGSLEDNITETIDLPISSQLTESITAFEYYIKALLSKQKNNNQLALNFLNKSLKQDPYFTWAHFESGPLYFYSNKMDSLQASLKKTIKNIERFPGYKRSEIKYIYYTFNRQPEKALNVLKNWVIQFPNNIDGHQKITKYYWNMHIYDKAIYHQNKILTLDPLHYNSFWLISEMYRKKGRYNESILYRKKYMNATEENLAGYIFLGDIFRVIGELDSAKFYYTKAEILDPLDLKPQKSIVRLNSLLGNISINHYYDLFSYCITKKDSLDIFYMLSDFYQLNGQISKAESLHDSLYLFNDKKKISDSISELLNIRLHMLLDVGKTNDVLSILSQLEKKYHFDLDSLTKVNKLNANKEIMLTIDNVKSTLGIIYIHESINSDYESYIKSYIDYIENYYENNYNNKIGELKFLLQAKIEIFNNNYQNAIAILETNQNGESTINYLRTLARYLHAEGNFIQSKNHFNLLLKKHPNDPKTHYFKALLLNDMGESEQAIYHLDYASKAWEDADENYIFSNMLKANTIK